MTSKLMSCSAPLTTCLWGEEAWAMHVEPSREEHVAVLQGYNKGQRWLSQGTITYACRSNAL